MESDQNTDKRKGRPLRLKKRSEQEKSAPEASEEGAEGTWKVLVVDDDEEVHRTTGFVLKSYTYDDKKLEIINAYSQEEAKAILKTRGDIALAMLDVVMEDQHSGLDLVEYIRGELGNHFIRLVLRTGQPGVIPERQAIERYDINDYRNKTELTDIRLYTSITTALRSYNDIMVIEGYRRDLEAKVQARTRELRELNEHLEQRVEEETARRLEQEQLLIQQSKMAAMGEMMGMIAHQWRQPLAALNLVAMTLKQDAENGTGSDEETIESADMFSDQIGFMNQTIEDFRNFLKPSKEKQVFDIVEAVQKVVQILGVILDKADMRVDIQYVDCQPGVALYADGYRNEFMQVVMNIINNAKDAVYARRKSNRRWIDDHVDIRFVDRGEHVAVYIADTGGGIPESEIRKIFDSFFTTKGECGTGIGLYMSRTIIESHMGGKLEVENREEGAEFRIILHKETPA